MAENSKIEWCHHTQNFWIGCAKVSPGCTNCYAAVSTPARAMKVIWGANADRHVTGESNWNNPLRWNKNHDKFYAEHGTRQRVFCQSLSDVFDNHPGVVDARARMWKVIKATPNLDWLLLTKRIGNVYKGMLPLDFNAANYPNVWLGISVVNQEEADRDIPKLLGINAAVRWLSMEPLLGPVNLTDLVGVEPGVPGEHHYSALECDGDWNGRCIDWVIVGGESGNKARPMHPEWARSLRDQCAAAGAPFLFKQWGEWLPFDQREAGQIRDSVSYEQNGFAWKVRKKIAGRLLDGVQHDGYPEVCP